MRHTDKESNQKQKLQTYHVSITVSWMQLWSGYDLKVLGQI